MLHASRALRPWRQLTTGVPTALATPVTARALAQAVAKLQGCESATLATSTLHLFWDLFGILAGDDIAIFMDAGAYPIAAWGVERAAAAGVPVQSFSHYQAEALEQRIRQSLSRHRIPVIVTDGLCPECGRVAPLADYWKSARTRNGYLIIDDTQASGILGHSPNREASYGHGGGGSLCWTGVRGDKILIISSLAKGFGVPIAVLSGSEAEIGRFENESETRVHCSPPAIAALRSLEHALAENEAQGDTLREHLSKEVRYFRELLTNAGFAAKGGLFPVQTLAPMRHGEARTVHARLLQNGVRPILHRGRSANEARLSFIITALHRPADLERAVAALAEATDRKRMKFLTSIDSQRNLYNK